MSNKFLCQTQVLPKTFTKYYQSVEQNKTYKEGKTINVTMGKIKWKTTQKQTKQKKNPFKTIILWDTYGENFPSTNLKRPISYVRIGMPSHICKKNIPQRHKLICFAKNM